jgi:hypothetical protein
MVNGIASEKLLRVKRMDVIISRVRASRGFGSVESWDGGREVDAIRQPTPSTPLSCYHLLL